MKTKFIIIFSIIIIFFYLHSCAIIRAFGITDYIIYNNSSQGILIKLDKRDVHSTEDLYYYVEANHKKGVAVTQLQDPPTKPSQIINSIKIYSTEDDIQYQDNQIIENIESSLIYLENPINDNNWQQLYEIDGEHLDPLKNSIYLFEFNESYLSNK